MLILECEKLAPGMLVSETVYLGFTDKILLTKGTKLTIKLIRLLIKRGVSHVTVSERYTLDVHPIDVVHTELKSILENEIIRLAPESVEGNTTDDMVEISRLARKIKDELLENEILLKICLEMKINSNDYLYKHCVGSCALTLLVAAAMKLPDSEIYDTGAAALVHDLGMCEMPFLINRKDMNKAESLLFQEHPKYGYYFAKDAGLSEGIAKLILNHHERWNGSGFPNGLLEDKIPMGSRIIAVCESYNRLIVYQHNPEYLAIEYLYGSGNYLFDANVVNVMTNHLAVYPLGSIVRLSTGEVGIVVNVRQNIGPRPIVALHFNKVNKPITKSKYIDLSQENTVFITEVLK
ncbi:HD-GYP domain-containing protein [Clostridium sp.]|uniref:HD-GYP domain-containing protein n=1 Tax=Clostridium sp. TaxID=1506 RepID=UPI003D6CDC25